MSTTVTPATLQAILQGGTYPANSLATDQIFDYEHPILRRRYPSVEIIIDSPESTESTQKATNKTLGFKIFYYSKILAVGSDEVANQKLVEDQILSLMESATLEDPNIILEVKRWTRENVQPDGKIPGHIKSTLQVTVRNIILSNRPSNALLTFDNSNSTTFSNPGSNYQYTEVYDASIIYGYNSIEESVTRGPVGVGIPVRFRGKFHGKAIFNIYVKPNDFGSTGDKLNQLNTLLTGEEKPEIGLIFQAYDASSPTPRHSVNTIFRIDVDEVQQIANFNDNQVFRVIGTITRPPTVSDS